MVVEPEYVTPEEASELLRRPTSTLAYWRHRGEGPPYAKIGRRVLYRRVDVMAWLADQFDADAGDIDRIPRGRRRRSG